MLSVEIDSRPESVKSVLEHSFFEDGEETSSEALANEFKRLVD